METQKSRNDSTKRLSMRKYNITNILYQYVVHERSKVGRGDENNSKTTVALYPSEYNKQIKLSTKERLELASVPSRLTNSLSQLSLTSSFPLNVTPGEIIFQQFTPGNSYTTTITISNTSKMSHFVKLICEPNETFNVDLRGSVLNIRLAPGMSHIYKVQFRPRDKRDYEHQLSLMGDFKTLNIPMIALGPRAILDFPDRIMMPDTPVNIQSSKTILVKNVGNSDAVFTMTSSSLYFSIKPSCGVIKEQESLQFIINFTVPKVGSFSTIIYLRYEIGELLRMDVYGTSFNCNVKLETERMTMSDTFIGLSTSKSLIIHNDSDYVVKFMWMKNMDAQKDGEEKKKLATIYNSIEEDDNFHRPDLNYVNLFDSHTYKSICKRVHTDDVASLAVECFLYRDHQFLLTPMIGEIWPKSFMNVTVNFQPNIIGEISSQAYLEIMGRETRLPLTLIGVGMGPILRLNTKTIDIGEIYLGSTQNFEIVCTNKGLIPGVLIPKDKSSDFGGQVLISPQQLEIQPGEHSSFNLTFSSSKNGEFIETVEFLNQDNSETLLLYIKGHVICPTLYFDQPQVDFGMCALGFTFEQEATIRNVSSVPVSFSIIAPEDGNECAITYETFMNEMNVSAPVPFPSNPREFFTSPSSTMLAANSFVPVKIYFTPNTERAVKTYLKIIIEGSDAAPIILPIICKSKVASCTVKPSGFNIQLAFINFPYTLLFTMENTSDVEGFFYFLRESTSTDSMTFYSMSRNQWHLKPGQSRSASVTIITRALGRQEIELKMGTYGKETIETLTAVINGRGPVLSVIPKHLDFGDVKLLHELSMSLDLVNDSPIPANFKAYITNKNSPWSISVASGEIKPMKTMNIITTLFLRDTGKQSDKILIAVANSPTISVSLCAHGSGSSIRIHPNIFPNFDMGQLLSHQDNFVPLNLTNESNRWQKLIFSNTTTVRNSRSVPQMPSMTTFNIEPPAVDLPPRSTKEVNWLIHSDRCESISEQWWVYSAAEEETKRQLIGMSNLTATFIEPTIKFNKNELHFHINVGSDDENSVDEKVINELEVWNISQMDLKVHLAIRYPFVIITENDERVNNTSVNLNNSCMSRIRVCFSPNFEGSEMYSENFVECLKFKYNEHPNRDEIKCKGTVNYPNIIPIPRELQFDTSLCYPIEKIILLNNDGPIRANYQLSWVKESFDAKCRNNVTSSRVSRQEDDSSESNNDEKEGEIDIKSSKAAIVDASPNDAMDQMFKLSSMSGTVLPYSTAPISINFHTSETICVSVQLLCRVFRGPAEYIKVTARADKIKYTLDKTNIDFGNQPLFKLCQETIDLSNICEIEFRHKIDITIEDRSNSKGVLSIIPEEGSTDPGKITQFEITYRSRIPGDYKESFNITIGSSNVVTISIKGTAVLPQVYLPLPSILSTRNIAIEDEYNAINHLNIIENIDNNIFDTSLNDENAKDFQRLVNNGWEIVSSNDKTIPGMMDLEMIIEKYAAVKYINDNKTLIAIHTLSSEPVPIPLLFSTTYELNLGYAVIEQYTVRSTAIINYSSVRISVRMKNNMKENYLTKYGITMKFRDRVNMMPREFVTLDIGIHPLKKDFPERSKLIKRKIHLEVINGCTIPIAIVANVTAPWLMINTNSLNFGHVSVGNCKLLKLFVKNVGLINCRWIFVFSNTEKKIQMQFQLHNYQGNFVPGESGHIDIYFRPQKSGYFEAELNILVHEGLEQQKICLSGRGIEKKLKIEGLSIEFLPVTPYSVGEVRDFNIRNVVNCPVEFYWQHLDHLSVEEDRIIKILLHYYQVDEILLPTTDSGVLIPQRIYDFYYALISEMFVKNKINPNGGFEDMMESQVQSLEDGSLLDDDSKSFVEKRNKRKSLVETHDSISIASAVNSQFTLDSSDVSNDEIPSSMSSKPQSPEEIEKSLYEYINKLHEDPGFFTLKTDPLKEIFNEFNAENKPVKNEIDKLNKQICIIFHGAPFTQYQETACRVGRTLGLSVINLDSAITEMIALGESSNSSYLRELIDDKYKELLQLATRSMNDFDLLNPGHENETKLMNSMRIDEIELERFKKNIHFHLPEPEDALTRLRNFPSIDEMNCMEQLCRYEYEIEGIHLLQDIVDTANATMSMTTNNSKSVSKRTIKKSRPRGQTRNEETFLDIDLSIFEKLLQEMFSDKKYDKGFVLQRLDNNFIKPIVSTLLSILHVVGQTKFMAFVTFHNSYDLYKRKFAEKQSEILLKQQEKLSIRLKTIDEMSASAYELLSKHEKNLFLEKVLRPRIDEAQQRRKKFKEEYLPDNTNPTATENTRGKGLKEDDKHQNRSQKKDKKQKKSESIKLRLLTEAFMNYEKNLDSIVRIIQDNFHIWHVKFSNPWDSKTYDIAVNQISENQLINGTLIDDEIIEPVFYPQLYSIVSRNSKRLEYPSAMKSPFKLIQLSCNSDINSVNSINSKIVIEENPQPRMILEPEEVKKFKIAFEPTCVGSFTEKFQLSIAGVSNKTYRIDISGKSDIPHLKMDPVVIFNRVERRKQGDSNEPTYFIDKKTFDFGYLLIVDKDEQKKIHKHISQFNFFNSSLMNVDVEFHLAGDNWEMFDLLPRALSIKPNEFGAVQVTATALKSGVNTDRLLLIIRNNPHIEEIILECLGCELDVELSNRNLLFGRVLLFRKECRSVTLKNKSAVPIFWKILSQDVEEPQVVFPMISNWTRAFSENNIEVCYHGQKVGSIKQLVNIAIFLDEHDVNPLLLKSLTISGETYDVAVDVNDANPINFKSGRVGKTIRASFSIKNRGQHDINFVIELENMKEIYEIDRNLPKNLREDFHIDPKFGCLLPNKKTLINVKFTPKIELHLKQAALLKCNLLDTNIKPTIIAELPFTVTIRAEYNKFDVEPYPELFFGPVSAAAHKEMPFYIKNIGIFPLRYKIVARNSDNLRSSIQSRRLKKKGKKNSTGDDIELRDISKTPKKGKSMTKSDHAPLRLGIFTLKQNQEGTLDANQVEKIVIDCYSETEDHFETEISIFVDNCSIEDQNGRKLKLSVDFFKPRIDFEDLDSMFIHSHVVNSIKDFNCPSRTEPLSIFTKDEMCLYFERVIVSTTHTVKLKLNNTSLVPAEVSMCLRPDTLFPKNSPAHTFTLDPLKQYISPLSSGVFIVSFTPTLMETYTGCLEAFVDLPSHIDREKFLIKLSGEGFVAEIVLLEPEIFCKRGHAVLEYGKCLVGETITKDICFQNVGKIGAKVTTEILEDMESLYELKTTDVENHNKVGNHCIEVNTKPGDVTQLSVLFTPKDKGKYEAHVRLLTAENPYENLMINLNGEGFIEPVILNGLPLFKPENAEIETTGSIEANREGEDRSQRNVGKNLMQQNRTASETSSIDSVAPSPCIALIYILQIGGCFLKEERELSFMIVNKTTDKIFRFEWNYHENFIIKPSIGHLYCLDNKNISVTFIASEPVSYDQIPLDCAISEIQIIGERQDVAWNDQNVQIDWIKSSSLNEEEENVDDSEDIPMKEIVYAMDEPVHEVMSPTHVIQLLVSASANHATYSCSIDEIKFGDTFIFQTKEQKFEIRNSGIVNLTYSWKIYESSVLHPDSSESICSIISDELIADDPNKSHATLENLGCPIIPEDENRESIDENECRSSFGIEPAYGSLFPGQAEIFTAHFSPTNAVDYHARLICSIENLDPEVPLLIIAISGTGLLPYYHFELPTSSHLSTRKEPSVPQDVKVVEFKVIGVGKNYIKHFNLINPMTESYHFSWIDKTVRNSDNIPYFHCKSQKDMAEGKKQTKITFTFLAHEVGIFEALWTFLIHEYNLEVPFLLVGIVTEPRVICCTPKITMPPTTLGVRVQDTMIIRNNEDFPLTFRIIDSSIFSEGQLQSLSVEPISGILSSQNDQEFVISYGASRVGNFFFILQCEIERMKEPLKCCITANVSKIQSQVIFSRSPNEKIKLETEKINVLDMGKLMLKNITTANFEITNMTDIAIQYAWNLNSNSPTVFRNNEYIYKIEIDKVTGFIENKSRIISTLQVTAIKKLELKNHPITLKIIDGPLYKAVMNATAKQAPIEFSFAKFNFGACYIKENVESSPYNVELRITNNEDTFAIVECNNVPPPFTVDLRKLLHAIPERGTVSIPIEFHPIETKKYQETLVFMINSNIERKIHLKGEGINYKVGLVKPRDKFINFGDVLIGKIVKRSLTIINSAKVSVKLKIGLIKKSNDTLDSLNISNTLPNSLHFVPAELLTLCPNRAQDVVVEFSPTQRISLFEEKIGAFCTGSTTIPLSFIRGRCVAAEFNLNRTHLLFDTVVEGFSKDDKLILHNSGDIGSRFKWNVKKLGPNFTLKPLAGYSTPGKNIAFNVGFNPIAQSNVIKGEAIIAIENYKNITISLIGSCSKLPDPKNTIQFSIPVRSEETKNINVSNNMHVGERIEIVTTGDYFQSANILFVGPNSSASCSVTYAPLLMTKKSNLHTGTLVMKFYHRNSIEIYALQGISLPPEAVAKISREIPEKIKYSETLPVYNWLNKPQCFTCTIEMIGKYEDPPIYKFNGSDKIEILANGTRNYGAVLCCYRGSILNFRINFINHEGEYQFYEVQYRIIKLELIETIELTTVAQKSSIYSLKIENPLENESMTYSGNCPHPDIKIVGLPKILAPGLEDTIAIHYSPMIASESETTLNIISTKLGVFPYRVKMKATSHGKIYRTLPQMTAALGSCIPFSIVIKNNSELSDEFTITIDNSSFTCQMNKISILARDENLIEVTYEPFNIGVVQAKLIISSTMNPEIIYDISGNGVIPKPRGPFILKPNQPVTIPFKNVFLDTKTFKYIVDPTVSFATSSSSNVITSKQTANITVKFQDLNGSEDGLDVSNGNAVTGKLIVYCTDSELSSINWIYYLKGTPQ